MKSLLQVAKFAGNENNFVGDAGAEDEFGRGCEVWWEPKLYFDVEQKNI